MGVKGVQVGHAKLCLCLQVCEREERTSQRRPEGFGGDSGMRLYFHWHRCSGSRSASVQHHSGCYINLWLKCRFSIQLKFYMNCWNACSIIQIRKSIKVDSVYLLFMYYCRSTLQDKAPWGDCCSDLGLFFKERTKTKAWFLPEQKLQSRLDVIIIWCSFQLFKTLYLLICSCRPLLVSEMVLSGPPHVTW